MLGQFECDYDTAYFMENGKYPKRNYKWGMSHTEISRCDEIWENKPNEYFCLRGYRIPQCLQ